MTSLTTPTLKHVSSCNSDLDFKPVQQWPSSIPAVSVNGYVLAGFGQETVFDHAISDNQADFADRVAGLFRSLYFDLSFTELARLWKCSQSSKKLSWFPWEAVFKKFHIQANLQLEKVMMVLLEQPIGFQNWCAEKKLFQNDLVCLLSADQLKLHPVFLKIIERKLNKSFGTSALELSIELLMMGKTPEQVLGADTLNGEEWVEHLKALRFPDSYKRDEKNQKALDALPLPSSAQAKWVRKGDKAGVEIKLFVSNPSDLQKHVQSLGELQNLLENQNSDLWTKH